MLQYMNTYEKDSVVKKLWMHITQMQCFSPIWYEFLLSEQPNLKGQMHFYTSLLLFANLMKFW